MDREEIVLAASSMYYLQDLKMETIAARLHVSRSSVSRLLKSARETGLVEITLRPTPTLAPAVGLRISERFGIETFVIPVIDTASESERLDQVAKASARLVTGWFDSDMVFGLAWGRTLAAISQHLKRKTTRGSTIVQLNGAANTRTTGVDYAGVIISLFADAFDARVHYFPVPAFFDYAETRRAMWRERSIARVLDLQRRADIALFSVGALRGEVPSHVYSAGYLEPGDIETLEAEGVVGDVCTVFLRADGSYRDLSLNERATGPTPDELLSVPLRVCAVAGERKVVPLLAALRSGVVTHLVVDEQTASSLVRLMDADAASADEAPVSTGLPPASGTTAARAESPRRGE